jgi:pantoate kinase
MYEMKNRGSFDNAFKNGFVKAYSPSHITGFFVICDNKNPVYKGSVGCGLVLDSGCVTDVSLSNQVKIKINGIEEDADTTKYVLDNLAGESKIIVSTDFEVPIESGFGASGAGALSTAIALNELLSLNMTLNEIVQVAHRAEVKNNTGLGDVIAEAYGGIVIRKKAGPPGIGVIDGIPQRGEKISYVVLGKKLTKAILEEGDAEIKRRINEYGREALKELMRMPTIEQFMLVSRNFSLQIEIISDKCRDAIAAVAAEGKVASVAMLGDTVFVIGDSEALSAFGEVKESKISYSGARLI